MVQEGLRRCSQTRYFSVGDVDTSRESKREVLGAQRRVVALQRTYFTDRSQGVQSGEVKTLIADCSTTSRHERGALVSIDD